MARRSSLVVGCFLVAASVVGAGYGCAAITGIPINQRLTDFWNNDVKPLWRFGVNPELEPEEMLDDITPAKGVSSSLQDNQPHQQP